MALRTGLEPMTLRLTAACSTNWANEAYWRPEGDLNPWPLAWQASVLTNWTTRPYMWEYPHPLWQRPLCAVFLTSGKIKHLEFIYPKIHTKLPLCLERLVSCIQYILAVLQTPFNQLLLYKKHLRPPSAPTWEGRLDMTYQFRLRGTKICTRGK